jgi:hypothetical protein
MKTTVASLFVLLSLICAWTTLATNGNPSLEDTDKSLRENVDMDDSKIISEALGDEIYSIPTGDDIAAPKPGNIKACWKDGESRGKGVMPDRESKQCPDNKPDKSMGMCYPKCGDKRTGFGPLCWDDCKSTPYKSDGFVFCCDTDEVCADLRRDLAVKFPKAIVRFAIDLAQNPYDIRRAMSDFREVVQEARNLRLPLCSKLDEANQADKETEDVNLDDIIVSKAR